MNNNYEIISEPIFNLPLERDTDDFIKFIENKFNDFYDNIKKFDGELGEYVKKNSEIISGQMNCIYSSINSYYEGKNSLAYSQLVNCLEKICCHLWIQSKEVTEGRDKLYRVRLGEYRQYSKKDLFHIPFEKRNLVKRQRYSLPGLPCLYLSTSIYTCWEELNRPNIDKMHVSRFDLNIGKFKFLFLDQRPEIIRNMLKVPYENCSEATRINIENFIVTFPLLLVCNIKVKDYESDFVPEYIFPQLLLQWVNNIDEIDGIQYVSNKTQFSISPITFLSETNIVIPPKKIKGEGYCEELTKRIKITNPISYQLLEIKNPNEIKIKTSLFSLKRNFTTIELLKGEPTKYSLTKFGILEKKLNDMNADYL